jgi:hypothetical protein
MSGQNQTSKIAIGEFNLPGLAAFKKVMSIESDSVHGGQDNKKDLKNQNDCANCGRPVRFSNFCSVQCQRETFGV